MRYVSLIAALLLCLAAPTISKEHIIQPIDLAYPLNEDDMEFSGMTWCGDTLILLPQYPERHSKFDEPSLYAIDKSAVLSYLNATSPSPLQGKAIKLFENNIRSRMMFFDGYEAIACEDETVWLSIEAMNLFGTYQAYIVPAELDLTADVANISVRTDQIRYVESQSGLRNKGDEAILIAGEYLISLHEVNDQRQVEQPKGNRVHTLNGKQDQIDFQHLPYRVTDATAIDESGKFWLINYKYSGDDFAENATDPLSQTYPMGSSHKRYSNVERLIEYRLDDDAIFRTERAPIQLFLDGEEGRNWEGITRLDHQGFLLVTDKHPSTLFGFVSNSTIQNKIEDPSVDE